MSKLFSKVRFFDDPHATEFKMDVVRKLDPLPVSLIYCAATFARGKIYVMGGLSTLSVDILLH